MSMTAVLILVAAAAAAASPIGGLLALWRRPTSLVMSLSLGFASGVLLATISIDMVPSALEVSSLQTASAGFHSGFAAILGVAIARQLGASGVLLATIIFEMVPSALEVRSLQTATAGFLTGFAAIYGLDLAIHRGRLVGRKAEQRLAVRRFHQRHPPKGDEVTVLAGGTS